MLTGLPFIFKEVLQEFLPRLAWRGIFTFNIPSFLCANFWTAAWNRGEWLVSEWENLRSFQVWGPTLPALDSFEQLLSSLCLLHCQVVVRTPQLLELLWGFNANFLVKNIKKYIILWHLVFIYSIYYIYYHVNIFYKWMRTLKYLIYTSGKSPVEFFKHTRSPAKRYVSLCLPASPANEPLWSFVNGFESISLSTYAVDLFFYSWVPITRSNMISL